MSSVSDFNEMTSKLCLFFCWILSVAAKFSLVTQRTNYGYTSVPRDVNTSVTTLDLSKNQIVYIDNTSFPLYNNIENIIMTKNPLTEIRAGSFDNNPVLQDFACNHCRLAHFPVDFGAATASLKALRLMYGLLDVHALAQVQLRHFPRLERLELWGNRVSDINWLYFPTATKFLDIGGMRLRVFPNLTASRFPKLWNLRIRANDFQDTLNPFEDMNQIVTVIDIQHSKLKSVSGVETLSNLYNFYATGNELETVPDLLGLKNLIRLKISDNSRMTCDQRMCWRRLLNRVRNPLTDEDDVTCVHPPAITGHPLSTINPKFMNCVKGNSEYCTSIIYR